jgi:integrase
MAPDGPFLNVPRDVSLGSARTLADVVRLLEADQGLVARERGDLCSALRTVCRVIDQPLDAVPAHPSRLRAMLARITPAAAGVTKGRWSNIRSLAFKALNRAGIPTIPGRYRDPLAPEWEDLRALLPGRYSRASLSRFMSHCSARHIRPEEVTADTFEAFAAALDIGMMRDPGEVNRESRKAWNTAAQTIPAWPRLVVPVPDRRNRFADDLEAFPASFAADVERFLAARENPDIFSDSYAKPVRPGTNKGRRQRILMAATALVKSGFPRERLTGLDVLVELANARAAMRLLYERAGSTKTGYLHHIATTLKNIATKHAGKDPKTLKGLADLCRNLNPGHTGLTEKNKRTLRQFADPKKLDALLSLPERTFADAHDEKGDRRREAVRVTFALAVAIELVIPLRARNLAGLRVDQLHRVGDRILIEVALNETKNEEPINAEFPPWLVRLIDEYMLRYRPRLLTRPSPWLFPGRNGGRRNSGGFGAQIADFISREIGVTMTLHQFRHLAAKLYLDRHPGDYETVRRLLGHKSRATTQRFYHELESVLAVRRYCDLITEFMEERIPARPVKRRGSR